MTHPPTPSGHRESDLPNTLGVLEQPQTLATRPPELSIPEVSFPLTPHGAGYRGFED